MLKEWQFNVLFFVGVGSAVLLLIGPEIGLHLDQNPTALGGVGTILTYVLMQKKILTKDKNEEETPPKKKEENDEL